MIIYYLYVKTHNRTGLKYLGQTKKNNPHKYPGSGKGWKSHLKEYGYDYTTEILQENQSKEEIARWGRYYSTLWDIVNSNNWANQIPETGGGAKSPESAARGIETKRKNGTLSHSDTARDKMSIQQKHRFSVTPMSEDTKTKISACSKRQARKPHSDETKANLSSLKKGHIVSEETRGKISAAIKGKTGHAVSEDTKLKISTANKGKTRTDETKAKLREAKLGKKRKPFTEETKSKMRAAKLRPAK
jgi:hypothetical protein